MEIETIGVIGSGVIGRSVAQNFAQCGFHVILTDISQEILKKARDTIRQNVRLYSLYEVKNKLDNPDKVIEHITFTTDIQSLKHASYVIENVTEKLEIKTGVYHQIDNICPESVIFAVNTSCIPVTKIASLTGRPGQIIGLHFMNPVPLIPTVEMIRGFHTSGKTIEITYQLLEKIDKKGLMINDSPGFVSNRLMTFMINEAAYLVHENVASVENIDMIIKSCYGHKMGPLATADLIGIDTILYSMEVLYESFNDSKFRPCPILRKMVDAGLLGRKTGQGFYHYS